MILHFGSAFAAFAGETEKTCIDFERNQDDWGAAVLLVFVFGHVVEKAEPNSKLWQVGSRSGSW